MTNNLHRTKAVVIGGWVGLAALAMTVSASRAQHPGHGMTPPAAATPGATSPAAVSSPGPSASGAGAGRRVTMEELHQSGGVPRGWKFALPAGDPAGGRRLFADLECYKCHAIQGESFPQSGGDAKNVGPELTGMGGMHPAEYFAESILSPNAVILEGPGYAGPDGKSVMPTYADSLSVTQLVDLVAYLKSLTAGGHAHHPMLAEKTAGDYTVRLEYRGGGQGKHAGHSGHAGHGAAAAAPGHLMVFVSDRTTGEPVPYLPVTATIRAAGKPAVAVKLSPMVGGQGFHYGVNVTLPEGPHTVSLAIGPASIQVMASARGRFAKPVTVVFDRGA
jgi:mono/diheme cytochrome c family protein